MTKQYDYLTHLWVQVAHPPAHVDLRKGGDGWSDEGWHGPQRIVIHAGERVWIEGCYSMEGHPEVVRIGDGLTNGYDEQGNCLLSVPAAWCVAFYTDKEAEDVMLCMDADERLLGYAR
jgi:hypothetical protein